MCAIHHHCTQRKREHNLCCFHHHQIAKSTVQKFCSMFSLHYHEYSHTIQLTFDYAMVSCIPLYLVINTVESDDNLALWCHLSTPLKWFCSMWLCSINHVTWSTCTLVAQEVVVCQPWVSSIISAKIFFKNSKTSFVANSS